MFRRLFVSAVLFVAVSILPAGEPCLAAQFNEFLVRIECPRKPPQVVKVPARAPKEALDRVQRDLPPYCKAKLIQG